MRTCLSRSADHEARSQVKVREKSSIAGRRRSQETSNEVSTAPQCKRHSRSRRTITTDRTSNREPHAVCGGNDTAKLANRPDRTRYLICYCCPESEAAMKTLMRVDTAGEQCDRHFSRAREGEVACEREPVFIVSRKHCCELLLVRGTSASAPKQQS